MDADFRKQIREMSLEDFIETFLWIEDLETMEYVPMRLWKEQLDLCRLMDQSKELHVPGTRQVGKSTLISAKAIKTILGEPRAQILIVSKNEEEAKHLVSQRIVPMLRTLPGVGEVKNGLPWPKWKPFSQRLEFYDENGEIDGFIETLTSNESAGKGRTARIFFMDEACDIEFAREIYRTSKPSVRKNPRGQYMVFSNSKPGSWFNRHMERWRDGKIQGIDVKFMSPTADPSISQEFLDEEKSKYETLAEFYQNYPPDLDSFLMKRHGKIFPTYDDREGGRHVRDFVPDWGHDVCFLYDHGFQHDSVFLICLYNKYQDIVYALDEAYMSGMDLEDISSEINRLKNGWYKQGMPRPTKRIADYSIFKRDGRRTIADSLRFFTNISFTPCEKYDERGTLAKLGTRISKNRLVVHPRCVNLRRQIRDWHWKNAEPGEKEIPVDKDNDGCDLLRYLENDIKLQIPSSEANLPARPFSKEMKALKERNRALLYGMPQTPRPDDNAWQAY